VPVEPATDATTPAPTFGPTMEPVEPATDATTPAPTFEPTMEPVEPATDATPEPTPAPVATPADSSADQSVKVTMTVQGLTDDNKGEVCSSVASKLGGTVTRCEIITSGSRRRMSASTLEVEVGELADAAAAASTASSATFVASLENLPTDVVIDSVAAETVDDVTGEPTSSPTDEPTTSPVDNQPVGDSTAALSVAVASVFLTLLL